MRVLLFKGCKARLDKPAIGDKAFGLLKALGHEVITLDNEVCCGAPYLFIGDVDGFKENAKKLQKMVNEVKADVMVTLCPNCTRTLTYFYNKYGIPLLTPVLHIVDFWRNELRQGRIKYRVPVNMRVTYQDSCIFARYLNHVIEPREVLKSIPGLKFVDMPEDVSGRLTRCCGGGGLVSAVLPELSKEISVDRVLNDVVPLNVDALITICPNCTLTLGKGAQALRSEGKIGELPVYHIVELLYRSVVGD